MKKIQITGGLIPTRAVIGVMMLLACVMVYMLRVNMSINIIAMVEPTGNGSETDATECTGDQPANDSSHHKYIPNYGERYAWDQTTQGYILGAYFWGYTITSFPGGFVAEHFGPMKVVFISTTLSALATMLMPLAASWDYGAVIVLRFATGFLGGVVYPAVHCLMSHWAPPEEKGKFGAALIGGTLGTCITWSLLGTLIEALGWVWAFYIPALLAILWCFVWYLLVSDTPDTHPRISDEEKCYIQEALSDQVTKTKVIPPYKDIFLSVPFWALVILQFGSVWGLYLMLTAGPKYMSEVLGYNLGHTGILAALPYLMRMLGAFAFGFIADFIQKHDWMTITTMRKIFVTFSHFIPGLLLFGQIAVGCDSALSVALITLSLGFNGASSATNLINPQDLAPNFAGTIYGITNGVGSITGFITPIITGYITQEHNGLREWHIIFSIGASIYIAGGLIFLAFGSAKMQTWNSVDKKESEYTKSSNNEEENAKY